MNGPEKQDASLVWDMRDHCIAIAGFIAGKNYDDYFNNRLLRQGVERSVEIIGEAAGKTSAEFRRKHSHIPWQKIISQRHVLAHEYGELKHERLWVVATVHVPELLSELEIIWHEYESKEGMQ